MANLWGGRFTKETDAEVFEFNKSILFDARLVYADIRGSMAHVRMLGDRGILPKETCAHIEKGLAAIEQKLSDGTLLIDETAEDVHSFVEAKLIEEIGEDGKKLHTGRSRNDQVALDMRIYVMEHISLVQEELASLLETLLTLMKEHTHTVMPGFTHLQKAQPTTLAHHLGAYFEMFRRDLLRLNDCLIRLSESPLGSGAFAGTTYPLDREETARSLGFLCACRNSMDGVSDRDYLLEYLFDLSVIMMHLSRFCEEIILWNSDEYRFIRLDDAFSTGSSIMPQTKNPDIAELIRGKTGRVYGDLIGLLTTMKGLPLAYNKDMQEDKEGAFDAMDTAFDSIRLFDRMLFSSKFDKDRMEKSAAGGFTNATDAADYLVKKGVAFRDAHEIIGRMVLLCLEKEKDILSLTTEELKSLSPLFEEDFYQAVDLKTCINERQTKGAPGDAAMSREIEACEEFLRKIKEMMKDE